MFDVRLDCRFLSATTFKARSCCSARLVINGESHGSGDKASCPNNGPCARLNKPTSLPTFSRWAEALKIEP